MNKGEFVEALADRLDVSRAQADRALSAVLDIIAEQLGEGEKVAFTGFGSFEVSERAARTGRTTWTTHGRSPFPSNTSKRRPTHGMAITVSSTPECAVYTTLVTVWPVVMPAVSIRWSPSHV